MSNPLKRFSNIMTPSMGLRLFVLLVLILAIPLTVFISQKQQELRQRAAEQILTSPQNGYIDIEEQNGWTRECQKYTNNYPTFTPCPDWIKDYQIKKSGNFSVKLHGSKSGKNIFKIRYAGSSTNPIKKGTKYKISASLRIDKRTCYNYLQVTPGYPKELTDTTIYRSSGIFGTKGIWCGKYFFEINETGSKPIDILQSKINDSSYIANEKIPPDLPSGLPDWFSENSYVDTKAGTGTTSLDIAIRLEGFEGDIWLDNISIEELAGPISHIDPYLFVLPPEYQGMKIKQVYPSFPNITPYPGKPIFIDTNAGRISIYNDKTIFLVKSGEIVGTITFPDNFLKDLRKNEGKINGNTTMVTLDNGNLVLSIGLDSSVIVRLVKNASIVVTASKKPSYSTFEAGIIFATDFSRGIFFSPVYTHQFIRSMAESTTTPPMLNYYKNKDFVYNDQGFEAAGKKNWTVGPNPALGLNQANWTVKYDFKKGDGFLTSLFPPKDFDDNKYCKERFNTSSYSPYSSLTTNFGSSADYSYGLQKFSERNNIALLWMNEYATSVNNQNPPLEYYAILQDINGDGVLEKIPVAPETSGSSAFSLGNPVDVGGPFTVKEPSVSSALIKFVNEAHKQGIKVIVYMSPQFYYTSQPDKLLDNLMSNINKFNLDGVYYDGLYDYQPLKDLALIRNTRRRLGNKIYIQHNSWTSSFILRTDHFRVPVIDAYADRVWVGESATKVDDAPAPYSCGQISYTPSPWSWKSNNCGQNVSNTVSMLNNDLRPVDYCLTSTKSADLSWSPQKQIDTQFSCKGDFRKVPTFGYEGVITDRSLFINKPYDSRYLYQKLDNYCLSKTCGDNICDVGETIYTCQNDCAPKTKDATLSKVNNTYTCNLAGTHLTDSIAQWIVDKKGFYKLHFTFDKSPARDDSENKMSPNQDIGVSVDDKNYTPPTSVNIDNRKAFLFGQNSYLFGEHDESLNFTNKNFSSFAKIKRTNSNNNIQIIFSLNSTSHFYYGIKNSKIIASVKSGGVQKIFEGTSSVDQNWHTIGIKYENGKLMLYFDGTKEKEDTVVLDSFSDFGEYSIGKLSRSDTTTFFSGYIDDLFVTDKALTDEQIRQYADFGHRTITLTGTLVNCIVNQNSKKYTAE